LERPTYEEGREIMSGSDLLKDLNAPQPKPKVD